MKLIIEIPDEAFEAYKYWDENKVATVEQTLIAHGIPYNPTGDCISRSDLRKEVVGMMINKADDLEEVEFEINSALAIVCEKIINAPTVNIEDQIAGAYNEGYMCGSKEAEKARPKGEWIKVKENRMSIDMSGEIVTRYKCSKCGRPIATLPSKLAEYYPFCHCGADMRGRGGK